MAGGIESSKQFIGIAVRKPYVNEYGDVLQRYSDTESGISEAHGHADMLAEKMNIPREAIRVARYGSTTSVMDENVARPAPKAAKKKTAPKVAAPKKATPAASSAPSTNTVTITKGGKSKSYNLGGK